MGKAVKNATGPKRVQVKDVDFVQTIAEELAIGCPTATALSERVGHKLGLKPASVTVRIAGMRKAGVNMPRFPRGNGRKRTENDIAGLNALLG